MRYAEKVIWVRELNHDWRIACSCGRMGWVIADKSDPPDAVSFYLQRFQAEHSPPVFRHLCYNEEMKVKVKHVGAVRPGSC